MSGPKLWFERLYARLRMPMWLGALVFAVIPFLVWQALGFWAVGLWEDFLRQLVPYILPFAVLLFVSQHASKYACDGIESLREYAGSLAADRRTIDTSRLYRFRPVVLSWLLLSAIVQPLYLLTLYGDYSPTQLLVAGLSPWLYPMLFAASFLWVFFYSMLIVYRMGASPLSLRPFTEDSVLGLKPFARMSLRLVTIYFAILVINAFPQIFLGASSTPVTLLFVGLFLLGIALFLVPLFPLHRKLGAAKAEETQWICVEYSKVVHSIRGLGNDLDEKVAGKLMAIDKMQRDIRQIRSWPFEAGILARLVAIVLSVTAIILSQILLGILNL